MVVRLFVFSQSSGSQYGESTKCARWAWRLCKAARHTRIFEDFSGPLRSMKHTIVQDAQVSSGCMLIHISCSLDGYSMSDSLGVDSMRTGSCCSRESRAQAYSLDGDSKSEARYSNPVKTCTGRSQYKPQCPFNLPFKSLTWIFILLDYGSRCYHSYA